MRKKLGHTSFSAILKRFISDLIDLTKESEENTVNFDRTVNTKTGINPNWGLTLKVLLYSSAS